jgi:ABC-type ATPase involved in cell division
MATHNLELVKRTEYRVIEVNRGQLVFDSAEGNGAGAVSTSTPT